MTALRVKRPLSMVLALLGGLVAVVAAWAVFAGVESWAQGGVSEPVAMDYVLATGAPAGSAEGVISTGGAVLPPAESHAWFVVPGARGDAVVLHVPPRRFVNPHDGVLRGSDDGAVRVAMRLDQAPSEIASWGERLYLLDDRPSGFEKTKRVVTSIRAVRSGVGNLWATYPDSGPESLPSLSGEGEIISFVGSSVGPTLLLEGRAPETDRRVLQIRMLVDRSWVGLSVPSEASSMVFDESNRRGPIKPWAMLVPSIEGLQLVCGTAEGTFRWSLRCDREFAVLVRQSVNTSSGVDDSGASSDDKAASKGGADGRTATVEWGAREMLGSGQLRDGAMERPLFMGEVCGRLVVVREMGLILQLREWMGSSWRDVQTYVGEERMGVLGIAPLDGVGRLAIVWPESAAIDPNAAAVETSRPRMPADTGREVRHQIEEVSVFSGREMFLGRWKFISPLASSDLKFLALILVGAMSLVVVFVLKAESVGVPATLPPGTAFAGPLMRTVATMIDFGVALAIASRVYSMGMFEVFSVEAMLNGRGIWAVLVALVVAAVIGSVCEAIWGRTLGKMICGCEVVDSRVGAAPEGRDQKAGVAASVLRNLLKWMLPPIGLLSMLDAQGRHPADRLAKTAVVVRLDEGEES